MTEAYRSIQQVEMLRIGVGKCSVSLLSYKIEMKKIVTDNYYKPKTIHICVSSSSSYSFYKYMYLRICYQYGSRGVLSYTRCLVH